MRVATASEAVGPVELEVAAGRVPRLVLRETGVGVCTVESPVETGALELKRILRLQVTRLVAVGPVVAPPDKGGSAATRVTAVDGVSEISIRGGVGVAVIATVETPGVRLTA